MRSDASGLMSQDGYTGAAAAPCKFEGNGQ